MDDTENTLLEYGKFVQHYLTQGLSITECYDYWKRGKRSLTIVCRDEDITRQYNKGFIYNQTPPFMLK